MQHITILEVEDLRRAIQRTASILSYVSVRDCLSRGKFNPMGRREFAIGDLSPYMPKKRAAEPDDADSPWDSHLFDVADDADESDEAASCGEEESAVPADAPAIPLTPEQKKLADAMVEWIRQACAMEIGQRRSATFQAQGWTAKGMKSAFSMRLAVVNQDADEMDSGEDAPERVRDDAPTIALPAPLEPTNAIPTAPESNWTQLGAHYRQFMDLSQHALGITNHATQHALAIQQRGHAHVLNSLSNVTDDLRKQLDHCFDQIRSRDEYIAELTGKFLDIKITSAEMNLPTTPKEDPEAIRTRRELTTTLINQLGSLGRLALSAKLGIPPELVELLDLISQDEKLVERLRDPDVRAMFREPGATQGLGQFLDLALEQFRAQKNAAPPPNPDAPVPPVNA